jgi:hypothetical protein
MRHSGALRDEVWEEASTHTGREVSLLLNLFLLLPKQDERKEDIMTQRREGGGLIAEEEKGSRENKKSSTIGLFFVNKRQFELLMRVFRDGVRVTQALAS